MPEIFVVKTDCVDEYTFKKLLTLLPEHEKEKFLAKKNQKSAINSLVGTLLARYALNKVFDIPVKEIEFLREANGKPYIKNSGNIHFNISHSEDIVVCAVSDTPVGIDVQKIKPISDSVIKRTCSENEIKEIACSSDPVSTFIYIWTRKEAVLKKKGTGISDKEIKTCMDNEKIFSTRYEDYWISFSTL